ncbi:MAG: hypothetical protein IGR80_00895 [Synechococcales cyanobacterium K44_A2020_017]|nr:hypothetical protein [Synechococcales cyanobacterium K32_A2020_035]MBF2093300.1 hypothetical protein [Synechococcales cyanobacterium K44_A2020_017]
MTIHKFALTRKLLATYFFRVGWLVLDCWHYFKLRIFGVVVLNWIGVTSAASVFGGFILYVRYLESGQPLTVLGIDIQLETPYMLAISAISLLCLGIMSSVCLYQTDWLIARLVVAYQKRSVYRLFEVASDPAYQGWQKLLDGPPSQAMQFLLSTSRASAIALKGLLGGILPALKFILALIFLVSTSVNLTALLIPLVLIYFIPLYQANHWVMQRQDDYSKLNRPAQKNVSQSLDNVLETHASYEQKMAHTQRVLESPEYQKASLLFYARHLVTSRLRLINTLFFTVCLISVFTFFAFSQTYGEHRWSNLLIYLFALQLAFSGLQQITTVIGRMSRLLPIYKYYVDFMSQVEQYRRHRQRSPLLNHPLPSQLLCSFSAIDFHESKRQLDIQPGKPVWIVISDAPNYSTLEAVAAHLEDTLIPPTDLLSKSAFIAKSTLDQELTPGEPQTLQQLFEFIPSSLQDYLQEAGLRAELEDYLRSQDKDPTGDDLSDETRYLLDALPLMQSKRVLWISIKPLLKLNSGFVNAILTSWPDRYLFLITAEPDKALARRALQHQRDPSTPVLIFGNDGFSGCSDIQWLIHHLADIQVYLNTHREAARAFYGEVDGMEAD